MAISVVQRNKGKDNNGVTGSVGVAFASNNTSGNAIIVTGLIAVGTPANLTSFSDTAGNTYAQPYTNNDSGAGLGISLWIATNIKAGANTVNIGNDGFNPTTMFIFEVSGFTVTNPFDQNHFNAQSSTTALNSGSTGTTNAANELLIGIGQYAATSSSTAWTLGSGYSNLQTNGGDNGQNAASEEQIVSSTGSYAATFTGPLSNVNSDTYIFTFGNSSSIFLPYSRVGM